MLRSLIVGIDCQFGGCDALALAAALAPEDRLLLGHVCPPAAAADGRRWLRQIREEHQVPAARLSVLSGSDPAAGLQRLAERRHADLIVIGCCHHAALGEVRAGRLLADILRGGTCPVAVAPRGFALAASPLGAVTIRPGCSPAAVAWAHDAVEALGLRLQVGPQAPSAQPPLLVTDAADIPAVATSVMVVLPNVESLSATPVSSRPPAAARSV